jgi:hypothetical protein
MSSTANPFPWVADILDAVGLGDLGDFISSAFRSVADLLDTIDEWVVEVLKDSLEWVFNQLGIRDTVIVSVFSSVVPVFDEKEPFKNPLIKELLKKKRDENITAKECILNCMNYGSHQLRAFYNTATKVFKDELPKVGIGGYALNREPIIEYIEDSIAHDDISVIDFRIEIPAIEEWAYWYLQENYPSNLSDDEIEYDGYTWSLDSVEYNPLDNNITCYLKREEIVIPDDEETEENEEVIQEYTDTLTIPTYTGTYYYIVLYTTVSELEKPVGLRKSWYWLCPNEDIVNIIPGTPGFIDNPITHQPMPTILPYEPYIERTITGVNMFPVLTLREGRMSYKTKGGTIADLEDKIYEIKKKFCEDYPDEVSMYYLNTLEINFPNNFPSNCPFGLEEHIFGNHVIWKVPKELSQRYSDWRNLKVRLIEAEAKGEDKEYVEKTKKLQRALRTLNLDLDTLVNGLEDNKDIDLITSAFLLFGVSISNKTELTSKILYFSFTSILKLNSGVINPENSFFKSENNTISVLYAEHPFSYTLAWSLDIEPETVYEKLERKYTHTVERHKITITWRAEREYEYIQDGWMIKRVEVYYMVKITTIDNTSTEERTRDPRGKAIYKNTNHVPASGDKTFPTSSRIYIDLVVCYRINANQYHKITMHDLQAYSIVYAEGYVEYYNASIDDKDDDGNYDYKNFLVPLPYSAFTNLNIFEHAELMTISLHLFINGMDRQVVRWYQNPKLWTFVQAVSYFVMFFVTVFSLGTSLTWQAAVWSLLTSAVVMVGVPLALKLIFEATDSEFIRVTSVIAAAVAVYALGGGDFASFDFSTAVGLTNLSTQCVNVLTTTGMERLEKQRNDFNERLEERQESFDEAKDKLRQTLTMSDVVDITITTGVPPPVTIDFDYYVYLAIEAQTDFDLLYSDFYDRMLKDFHENQLGIG